MPLISAPKHASEPDFRLFRRDHPEPDIWQVHPKTYILFGHHRTALARGRARTGGSRLSSPRKRGHLEGNKSLITTIIEDYPGQDPAMGSSQPPGPALVAASADADPVTLLVTAWLSARRSENTRAGYARDIGITPPRRPGRAPSWLTWCREQGVHPVTGVTMLHVARYARQLEAAGLSPASAARKLAAISSWYAWLARRGHISAHPAAHTARPRPGPRIPPPALTPGQVLALINAADTAPGSQRARTAALTAVLLFAGARLIEVTGADVADLGTSGGGPVRSGAPAHAQRP